MYSLRPPPKAVIEAFGGAAVFLLEQTGRDPKVGPDLDVEKITASHSYPPELSWRETKPNKTTVWRSELLSFFLLVCACVLVCAYMCMCGHACGRWTAMLGVIP